LHPRSAGPVLFRSSLSRQGARTGPTLERDRASMELELFDLLAVQRVDPHSTTVIPEVPSNSLRHFDGRHVDTECMDAVVRLTHISVSSESLLSPDGVVLLVCFPFGSETSIRSTAEYQEGVRQVTR